MTFYPLPKNGRKKCIVVLLLLFPLDNKWKEFKFQFNFNSVLGGLRNIKRGEMLIKPKMFRKCCFVCALIWRLRVKKKKSWLVRQVLCSSSSSAPDESFPLHSAHQYYKTLPPRASGQGRITNLTFIFLLSPPAHLCMLRWVGEVGRSIVMSCKLWEI